MNPASYENYAHQKGWAHFLECGRSMAAYYAGEFRGIPLRGREMLEIGFGAGRLVGWARSEGAHVVGIERNSWSLKQAAAAELPLLSAEDFAKAGPVETFDVIAAFDVFEHLTHDELRAMLRGCARALRPEGCLVLRYPNGQSPIGLYHQFGDPTHRTVLSRVIIEDAAAGLPLNTTRYAASYRVKSNNLKLPAQLLRYLAQDLIEMIVRAAYGVDLVMAPTVTHILRKAG